MQKLNAEQLIELCRSRQGDRAKEKLIEMLQDASIGLILSKTKVAEKHDALSIFYDAVMEQVDEMLSGKFLYVDEPKFLAYFRRKCIFKAREFVRKNIDPFIPQVDIPLQSSAFFETEYNEIRNEQYQRKNALYDINLKPDTQNAGLPKKVMQAFHKLSDKCKMLIILKKLMNVSHKTIVETLGVLYTISNENVSKNALKRCWKMLISMAA